MLNIVDKLHFYRGGIMHMYPITDPPIYNSQYIYIQN